MSAVPAAGTTSRELMDLVFGIAARVRDGLQEAHADLGLPPVQAQALSTLGEPVPMRELANRLACDASNVTGIVDGLERRGLVERRPDPRDRRVKQLVLTPEGERRRDTLNAHVDRVAAKVFDLPEADRKVLRDLLARLVDAPSPRR
ncbi:MarR family winged helix-turn-helix transcriptional regulator [Actinomadura sp. NBRC 104412]|uniref:MarR family winged helix-turn-helix transcriptional regulator n=1 Tax=Actinomadura sp. NBRC 104412 TaxID=3032203 RepID=UPI002554CEE5|nr:MarR family winged helix-turn-helix transcriptional regulator [Actinomadura sp. NBRC 104412]